MENAFRNSQLLFSKLLKTFFPAGGSVSKITMQMLAISLTISTTTKSTTNIYYIYHQK